MTCRNDFSDDRIIPDLLRLQFRNNIFRCFALLVRVIKNGRPVLRSDIVTLTMKRGGVVDSEKDSQQVAETRNRWVKGDLNYFGVARVTSTYLLV